MKPAPKAWVFPLQVVASVAVIGLLLQQADLPRVREELANASLGWLLIATLVKSASLHSMKSTLDLALARTQAACLARHRHWLHLRIGQRRTAGSRRGRCCGGSAQEGNTGPSTRRGCSSRGHSPLGSAHLCPVLDGRDDFWGDPMGSTHWSRQGENCPMGPVGMLCLRAGSGRLFHCRLQTKEQRGGLDSQRLLNFFKRTLEETGSSLGSWRYVALNLFLAVVQVALVVGCFAALLPTVDLRLDPDMPLLAVSGVIAFGALSAIVLPPSLGAGPAAAAVFVFGFFGIQEDQALAFAAMSWIANTAPVLLLGFWPFWSVFILEDFRSSFPGLRNLPQHSPTGIPPFRNRVTSRIPGASLPAKALSADNGDSPPGT